MDKNIMGAVQTLEQINSINKSYDNMTNSAVIFQRANELEEKSKTEKVTSGVINAAGTNVITKNIIPTDIGQNKVLLAIEELMQKYPGYTEGLNDIRIRGATVLKSDNSYDYPFKSIEESSDISAPTYVASDPLKPETVTVASEDSSVKSNFDINDLYVDVKAVNPYEHDYTDINTGRKINTSSILSYSTEGMIMQTSANSNERLPTYKLVPADQLQQNTLVDGDVYVNVSSYNFKDEIVGQDTLHERNVLIGTVVSRNIKYRYSYCLDEVIAEQRDVFKAAGYISKPIKVTPNSYIELSAEVTDGVEYSILEDNNETPILPQNVNQIVDEKLFFSMMPRFVIMNPDNIIVKRNNIPIGITKQKELEAFIMADITSDRTGTSSYTDDNVYTISYKPVEGSRRYFSKTGLIRVKVIQRVLNDQIPMYIGNVKLLQYNVTGSWYLSSVHNANSFAQINRMVRSWNT